MALCVAAGYCLNRCVAVIKEMINSKRVKREYPSLNKADDFSVCDGPHTWENSQLAMSQLPVKSYKICTSCGYVAGTEFQLNAPGREVLLNNIVRRKAREERYQAAVRSKYERSQEIMKKLIKEHVSKLNDEESNNVDVLKNFFARANFELDDLYAKLNKQVADEDNRG